MYFNKQEIWRYNNTFKKHLKSLSIFLESFWPWNIQRKSPSDFIIIENSTKELYGI